MHRFSRKVLAAAATCALFWPTFALAEGSPAEQAAEMMARAQAMDMKCNFFAAHERDKLSKFTARAELALANRESVEATKATMQRGRDAAQLAACSADEKSTAQQILAAALQAAGEEKQATKLAAKPAPVAADNQTAAAAQAPADQPPAMVPVAAAPSPTPPMAPSAISPVVEAAPVPTQAAPEIASAEPPMAPAPKPIHAPKAKKPAAVATAKPVISRKPAAGLGTYEKLTEAYYVARRCGGNQGAAYQAVVAEHGRVMQSHSASEVSAVLHRAAARAENSICS